MPRANTNRSTSAPACTNAPACLSKNADARWCARLFLTALVATRYNAEVRALYRRLSPAVRAARLRRDRRKPPSQTLARRNRLHRTGATGLDGEDDICALMAPASVQSGGRKSGFPAWRSLRIAFPATSPGRPSLSRRDRHRLSRRRRRAVRGQHIATGGDLGSGGGFAEAGHVLICRPLSRREKIAVPGVVGAAALQEVGVGQLTVTLHRVESDRLLEGVVFDCAMAAEPATARGDLGDPRWRYQTLIATSEAAHRDRDVG